MAKDADELRQEITETRERMGDTADAIAYKADVPHRVKDAVTGSIDQARRVVTDIGQRAADALPDAGDVQDKAADVMNGVRGNPLALFLGMVTAGLIVGSLLPATRLENERLGPVADRLKARAKDQVRGTIDAARDAAFTTITGATSSRSTS